MADISITCDVYDDERCGKPAVAKELYRGARSVGQSPFWFYCEEHAAATRADRNAVQARQAAERAIPDLFPDVE